MNKSVSTAWALLFGLGVTTLWVGPGSATPSRAQENETPTEHSAEAEHADQAEQVEDDRQDETGEEAESSDQASPERPQALPAIGYTDTPMLPGQPWRVHDLYRPRPRTVDTGTLESPQPPSDAIILFDGSDLSQWRRVGRRSNAMYPAQWKVENGYMEIVGGSGSIQTADTFGDCQIHLEWATPDEPRGSSQGRGNSGVLLMGRYELQVLDSYNNITYADGQAASIYGQYPPLVNASRPPGKWQVYDILFEAPVFDGERLVRPAYVTLIHNGALVQYHRELLGPGRHQQLARYEPHPPAGPLMLQDHGNPVRYRNIWIRRLELPR